MALINVVDINFSAIHFSTVIMLLDVSKLSKYILDFFEVSIFGKLLKNYLISSKIGSKAVVRPNDTILRYQIKE